jgi:hypothetical protein
LHQVATDDEGLLVRQGKGRAGRQGGEGRAQADRSGDPVEDDVGTDPAAAVVAASAPTTISGAYAARPAPRGILPERGAQVLDAAGRRGDEGHLELDGLASQAGRYCRRRRVLEP